MKKILILLFFIIILPYSNLKGEFFDFESCQRCKMEPKFSPVYPLLQNFYIEGKYAAFFPVSQKIRRLYHSVIPTVELEIAQRFCPCWQAFANLGYIFSNEGSSLRCKKQTKLELVPATLGIKYVCSLDQCLDVYIGAGLTYSFIRIKDKTPSIKHHLSKSGFGGQLKTGFMYYVCPYIFFEGFFDYMYQTFHFSKHTSKTHFRSKQSPQFSGFKLGFGLGIGF